jgi:hypothetical protein
MEDIDYKEEFEVAEAEVKQYLSFRRVHAVAYAMIFAYGFAYGMYFTSKANGLDNEHEL